MSEAVKLKELSVVLKPLYPHSTPELSKDLKKAIFEKNLLTTRTRKRFIDALDEIQSHSSAETKQQRREKVIAEILDSEKSYLNHLEKIVNYFMKPVQERKLLKLNDFTTVFCSIRSIYNVNKELLDELKKDDTLKNVTKAFSNIAPFFKMYSVYALNFKSCITFLQTVRVDYPEFSKFLEGQESRPEVQSKLSALLIAPIQRIPRYRLLLRELLNHTSPEDEEYKSLKDSLRKVEEAAEHINNIVDEQENSQRLLELQRYLRSGEPNIIVPGRKLIKEGILMKISDKNAHSEKIYVVLMSDIIMYCKMKKDELKLNSLKCAYIYPLNKCKVVEILDKGCFKVICQDQEVLLYHKQFSETKAWISVVKESIQHSVEDRKTLRKESSARRPVKRKDLYEYHDAGLSPGKPMKKKRRLSEELLDAEHQKPLPFLTRRRAIRGANSRIPLKTKLVSTPLCVPEDGFNPYPDSTQAESRVDDVCTDMVLYENSDQANDSITGKVGNFLGGIGNSVKRLFGFR